MTVEIEEFGGLWCRMQWTSQEEEGQKLSVDLKQGEDRFGFEVRLFQ
jgi:hypothetical protein